MVTVPKDLYYYVGEKPPALPCRYEDDDGNLITSISGKTLEAKVLIDRVDTAERTVSCSNNDDGTFTIDWGTTTSDFTGSGIMRVDILVTDSPRSWYMDRFTIEIRER